MGYDVQIHKFELNAVIELQGEFGAITDWIKGDFSSFPNKPNTSSTSGILDLYWIAPERWLLRSDIKNEDKLLEITNPSAAPVDISIVQISDTLKFFKIIGPDAGEIISTACPIDHHISAFPENGVSYTNIFGIKGILIRIKGGFEIAVESSFADLIEDYLARTNA
ncbi:MAG: heterotetrameric sarcosine oxidase gamma subunit [Polaribacter sp.]|jgi:heterotetrameric sarcosine oxidase gamma subunit